MSRETSPGNFINDFPLVRVSASFKYEVYPVSFYPFNTDFISLTRALALCKAITVLSPSSVT